MWKGRPVVALAVGGIRDQILDGESGLAAGRPERPGFLRERVRERFLVDRHLVQYADLFTQLLPR